MRQGRCTILVSSCDAYSDILDAFFKLLKKYWPNLKYDIVLSTETLDYKNKNFNIINVHPKKPTCTWTERIADALHNIKDDYVMLMLDDFFLYDYVNDKKIDQCIKWLSRKKRIASFTFWPIYSELRNCKYEGFGARTSNSRYKVAAIAGIWNKKKLLKYTKHYKLNIWKWEVFATKKSNSIMNRDKFYVMLNHQSNILPYDFARYGLFSGKWFKDTKKIFEKNNIKIDYSKRGFFNEWERPFCTSIREAFLMESSIVPYYGLEHSGSSYKPCKKKFIQGKFTQNYNIRGARNVVYWEPSVMCGIGINNLNIKVYYLDKTCEAIDMKQTFGNFIKKGNTYVFNKIIPNMYIPIKEEKKINKICISGNVFLLDDIELSKRTYNKSTLPKKKEYNKLITLITFENLTSKEKTMHISINPEIKYCNRNRVIYDYIDDRIFKKGNFKYEYNIPKDTRYILFSPSFNAGYKITNFKFKIITNDSLIINVSSQNIFGIPKDNIYLNREWIRIEIPEKAKKIIITGKCIYPLKSVELKQYIKKLEEV